MDIFVCHHCGAVLAEGHDPRCEFHPDYYEPDILDVEPCDERGE